MKSLKSFAPAMVCFILAQHLLFAQVPYDSTLAKKLHADDYGMKTYVMVFLKTGSATNVPKVTSDSLFRGHMDNINRLADTGKLVVAGPFFKNDKYRGIFILNATSIDEAKTTRWNRSSNQGTVA
jgi:uncharacterized protein YciI